MLPENLSPEARQILAATRQESKMYTNLVVGRLNA